MRVVFCGMTGQFSRLVLEELLRAGVTVVAIVLPALPGRDPNLPRVPLPASAPRGRSLPLFAAAPPRTILDIAAERQIPVYELGDDPSSIVNRLQRPYDSQSPQSRRVAPPRAGEGVGGEGLQFDALCIACFTRRIPPELLRLPRLGCLNVHPSLLPAHRGPDPLFWLFHDGDDAGGVTIHLMNEGYDTGPMLFAEWLPVDDETTEAALEHACAVRGGALLTQALAALDAGALQPQPQDESRASYQSWPGDDDFTITPAWSAQRAYRFITAIAGRGEPIRLLLAGASFVVRDALGYDATATLGVPFRLEGDTLAMQCSPGVLRCRVEVDLTRPSATLSYEERD